MHPDHNRLDDYPATPLLEAIFARAPNDQFLEVRPLRTSGEVVDRLFLPLRQLQRHGFDQAVPLHLDGKANVYFGVCPRKCHDGTAQGVALATCLWVDEIRKPWPEDLPQPSALVETSPGKKQAYWLLPEPSDDLEQVEKLNRRLAQALGGDNVGDRARIMRLPGFLNVKPEHPEHPRARLLELHPDRRHTLEEMEAAMPASAGGGPSNHSNVHGAKAPTGKPAGAGTSGAPRQAGHLPFDPHAGGGDVPQVMLDEVKAALLALGARRYHDGRLVMPCPLPHMGGAPCNCFNAFYWSAISGRWWCFCSDHPGRKADKECISGAAWRLWGVLFPGRKSPEGETSTSSPLSGRGEDARNSQHGPYDPRPGWTVALFKDAPRHKRTAGLLRMVGQTKKAEKEENCGVPLKGKCPKPKHGVVREGRSSGKTPWCAGCNTETSSKYRNMTYPAAPYTILRLQSNVEIPRYEAAEIEPGSWTMNPDHSGIIAALIGNEYAAATTHFRRVQRRFPDECLGWHFAVAQEESGLRVELQVLVRHTENVVANIPNRDVGACAGCAEPLLHRVLKELTGGTRKQALFEPATVSRYDYAPEQVEQLRRDWADLLKSALLRLGDDALFIPIHEALDGRQLSQAYGDLRDAMAEAGNGQTEDGNKCPVIEDDGHVCGCKLTFFLDPNNSHPVNPSAYRKKQPQGARAGAPP